MQEQNQRNKRGTRERICLGILAGAFPVKPSGFLRLLRPHPLWPMTFVPGSAKQTVQVSRLAQIGTKQKITWETKVKEQQNPLEAHSSTPLF